MMQLIQDLQAYIPFNRQEDDDRRRILWALENAPPYTSKPAFCSPSRMIWALRW